MILQTIFFIQLQANEVCRVKLVINNFEKARKTKKKNCCQWDSNPQHQHSIPPWTSINAWGGITCWCCRFEYHWRQIFFFHFMSFFKFFSFSSIFPIFLAHIFSFDFSIFEKKIELARRPKYLEKIRILETFRLDWQKSSNYRGFELWKFELVRFDCTKVKIGCYSQSQLSEKFDFLQICSNRSVKYLYYSV